MDILLSIKPKFVNEIISGSKKIEYRKKIFKNQNIDRIFIYSSKPMQKIVGYFDYQGYISETPNILWKKTSSISGISEEFFFDYFIERKIAYGIFIKDFIELVEPIDPYIKVNNFYPPQSYKYLSKDFFYEHNCNLV